MSLAALKSKTRVFARVDEVIVTRTDTGTNGSNLDSQETVAILDALATYNLHRPRRLTISVPAISSGYDQDLSSIVTGWSADTHHVTAIWCSVDGQDRVEMPRSDYVVYNHPTNGASIRFLVDIPANTWWMDFTAPHLITVGDGAVDTITSEAPGDVDAFCHLCASNVLQQAANHYAPKARSTISADAVAVDKQSSAYATRAKEERAIFDAHISAKPGGAASKRVDWGRPSPGQSDRFWRGRRYQ